MKIRKFLSLLLLSSMGLFAQNSIGLNVNADDIEIEGSTDLNVMAEYTNGTILVAEANYLKTTDEALMGIGLSASNTFQGLEGLSLGFGAKFVNYDEYRALPFVFEAAYSIPMIDEIPTATFAGTLLYAPSVLSFRDSENYTEYRFEASMEVISSVSLFAGYRNIEVDTIENITDNLNDSFYAGMKIGF